MAWLDRSEDVSHLFRGSIYGLANPSPEPGLFDVLLLLFVICGILLAFVLAGAVYLRQRVRLKRIGLATRNAVIMRRSPAYKLLWHSVLVQHPTGAQSRAECRPTDIPHGEPPRRRPA